VESGQKPGRYGMTEYPMKEREHKHEGENQEAQETIPGVIHSVIHS